MQVLLERIFSKCFRYQEVEVAANGTMGAEVSQEWASWGKGIGCTIKNVWKERSLSLRVKMGIFDSVVVSVM